MRKVLAAALPLTVAFMFASAAPVAAQNNPFNTADGKPDSGIAAIPDPVGSVKELGPVNSDDTKIGAINSALPPMLAFTNPNGQVDLAGVWLTTRKDLLTNDTWLYFAWQREANSGSGFISIEFQQSGLPSGCVYTGVDFSNKNDPETQALIANCNPWAGRKTGDFVIMWDQRGTTFVPLRDIKKRKFTCTGDTPGDCTLGGIEDLESVEGAIADDLFTGEMAINLTEDVFDPNAGCQTFANVIPGTVTGNSDSADYKDTVFSAVPPITNCGVLTIKKVTVAPDGVTELPDSDTVFSYRVFRADSSALRFAADAADHLEDGPAGFAQTHITRPNGSELHPAAGIKNGQTHTHTDLIAGTNYRLVEPAPGETMPSTYTLQSIICTDGSANSPVNITPPIDGSDTFQIVIATGSQKTECVITNKFIATAPDITTTQSYQVTLSDSASITNLQSNTTNPATKVTFRLYKDGCNASDINANLVATKEVDLNYTNAQNTAGNASSGDVTVTVTAGTEHTFYWRVFYPGDGLKNLATSTGCGLETTTVKIDKKDNGS
jgi:hypothetical protein